MLSRRTGKQAKRLARNQAILNEARELNTAIDRLPEAWRETLLPVAAVIYERLFGERREAWNLFAHPQPIGRSRRRMHQQMMERMRQGLEEHRSSNGRQLRLIGREHARAGAEELPEAVAHYREVLDLAFRLWLALPGIGLAPDSESPVLEAWRKAHAACPADDSAFTRLVALERENLAAAGAEKAGEGVYARLEPGRWRTLCESIPAPQNVARTRAAG